MKAAVPPALACILSLYPVLRLRLRTGLDYGVPLALKIRWFCSHRTSTKRFMGATAYRDGQQARRTLPSATPSAPCWAFMSCPAGSLLWWLVPPSTDQTEFRNSLFTSVTTAHQIALIYGSHRRQRRTAIVSKPDAVRPRVSGSGTAAS
jgi:hypothetical protein